MMKVAANNMSNQVLTIDEQGLVTRTIADLIVHAANRHSCLRGGQFFFNSLKAKDFKPEFMSS